MCSLSVARASHLMLRSDHEALPAPGTRPAYSARRARGTAFCRPQPRHSRTYTLADVHEGVVEQDPRAHDQQRRHASQPAAEVCRVTSNQRLRGYLPQPRAFVPRRSACLHTLPQHRHRPPQTAPWSQDADARESRAAAAVVFRVFAVSARDSRAIAAAGCPLHSCAGVFCGPC